TPSPAGPPTRNTRLTLPTAHSAHPSEANCAIGRHLPASPRRVTSPDVTPAPAVDFAQGTYALWSALSLYGALNLYRIYAKWATASRRVSYRLLPASARATLAPPDPNSLSAMRRWPAERMPYHIGI